MQFDAKKESSSSDPKLKDEEHLHTLWSCNYLQPDFQNPHQGLVRGSTSRTRVFALLQASFDCFALHRFGTIICVRNPWAGRCLKVFGTRFSLFLSASLCKQRSVAENSKDQAYVLPNVLTFGQKLIGSYRSALEMLQLLSYSTSRKILRHPKLDSGARHTQTGRKGLYGARWGWGLTRTVHQEQHWIHQRRSKAPQGCRGRGMSESEPTQNEPSEDVDVFCHFLL